MAFLSKIGSAIKRAAPEMIRGAIVAAANPTRGAVGTAGDIFGAIGAVEDDKLARIERQRQRDMQEMELRRKAEEDAQQAALNEARINEYKTRAEYNQRRGTNQTPKKSEVEQYKEMEGYLRSLKNSDGSPVFNNENDLADEVVFRITRVQPARMFNRRTPGTESAQMNSAYAEWRTNPDLRDKYPSFPDFWESTGLGQAKADTTGKVTTAKKEAEAPFNIRTLRGPDKYYQSLFEKDPATGKFKLNWVPTNVETPKPSAGKPPRARYRLETDDDGVQYRINLDNPADKVPTGIKKKVSGAKTDDLRQQLIQSLAGGAQQTKQTPKVSVGQTVRLKSGQTVTIKKVNPDGTFEY